MSRNRSRVGRLVILGVACFAPAVVQSQTSYPMLLRVDPVAVRRGQTVEIEISGQENWRSEEHTSELQSPC